MLPGAWIAAGVLAAVGAALSPLLVSIAQRQLQGGGRLQWPARLGATVAAAGLFLLVGLTFWGAPVAVIGYLVLAAAAVVLVLVDLVEQRLPNRVVVPTAASVAALLITAALIEGDPTAALGVALGAVGLFSIYLLLSVVFRGGIGMGDVKLALAVGAATGALGLRVWLSGLLAAFLINGIASLLALAFHRTTIHGRIPFGPSMLAGAFLAIALS